MLLILRAFSSGATAMTGIEVISNAVPVFKPPEAENARITLSIMLGLLVSMFIGVVIIAHLDGASRATRRCSRRSPTAASAAACCTGSSSWRRRSSC